LRANRNVRYRSGKVALRRCNPHGNLLLQWQDGGGHVGVREKPTVVAIPRINEPVVDVSEFDARDVEPRAARHPGLDRGVGDVRILHLGRGLNLDHPVAAVAADEDVGAHQDVRGAQRGLEQRDVARLRKGFFGFAQRGVEIGDVPDQPTFRV
jgi:hypothetical protein